MNVLVSKKLILGLLWATGCAVTQAEEGIATNNVNRADASDAGGSSPSQRDKQPSSAEAGTPLAQSIRADDALASEDTDLSEDTDGGRLADSDGGTQHNSKDGGQLQNKQQLRVTACTDWCEYRVAEHGEDSWCAPYLSEVPEGNCLLVCVRGLSDGLARVEACIKEDPLCFIDLGQCSEP